MQPCSEYDLDWQEVESPLTLSLLIFPVLLFMSHLWLALQNSSQHCKIQLLFSVAEEQLWDGPDAYPSVFLLDHLIHPETKRKTS